LIKTRRLPADRWKEYRKLRLEALKHDSLAFGSSYEEEVRLDEREWRRRIKNTIFAICDGSPIGMIAYVFNTRQKTKHIAAIYGVYVTAKHRGKGVGKNLVRRALAEIRKNDEIAKVQLSVNPELRPAFRLYKKTGFLVTGRAKKELKIGRKFYDLLYMEKAL
jgi:ribosomal protein S18 acetylase RimI-like enzyme